MTQTIDMLCQEDARLVSVREKAGHVSPRRISADFAGLCFVVTSQQVSLASAAAIFGRMQNLIDPLTPQVLLDAPALMIEAGQSRAKQRTLLALAQALVDGDLSLETLVLMDGDDAFKHLVAIKGIGPWTAQIFLMFGTGHPDFFPAGDVALQAAVGHAFGMEKRPSAMELAAIADRWQPNRSAAALLFWAYYREWKGRTVIPVLEPTK
ncbi:DNA-3-methyladenine glycosylase family protein [Limoniibacter endophyticus]|uniref:DNA-3-methyladenine glycosylase family protein n=1 Tax=Limoniibacter endophyticus TaxID=1565040 RepID=UPI0027E54572|nr:DNA-3-methyladenine glycosylase 2 family protein [Limoniibacter endophyticus]